jgi:hypothetical protein
MKIVLLGLGIALSEFVLHWTVPATAVIVIVWATTDIRAFALPVRP